MLTVQSQPNSGLLPPIFARFPNRIPAGQAGNGQPEWKHICPAHDDKDPSLYLSIGDDGSAILDCKAGCKTVEILKALSPPEPFSSLYPPSSNRNTNGTTTTSKSKLGKLVCTYDYTDETGTLLFQVCRYDPKNFRQRRPDPESPGKYLYSLGQTRKPLYRLPQIVAATSAETIYICEGEKDCDNVAKLGLIATTNPGGAAGGQSRKWLPEHTETLRGRRVVIIPDSDKIDSKTGRSVGLDHGNAIARNLRGVAAFVGILHLPNPFGLTPKWDASDWIAAGGTRDQLIAAAADVQPWNPADDTTSSDDDEEPNIALDDPHALAKSFLALPEHRHPDGLTIRFYRDEFYMWSRNSGAYEKATTKEVSLLLNSYIEDEFTRQNKKAVANFIATESKPLPPKKQKTNGQIESATMHALQAQTRTPGNIEMPFWIGVPASLADRKMHDGTKYIIMKNGIADVPAVLEYVDSFPLNEDPHLIPHSPLFFSTAAVPYEYELPGKAKECAEWNAFLAKNLEGNSDRIDLLQEWFGLNLVYDTSYQKFFMMEGEGANGKSVICAALTALIGESNVSHVPLEMFAKDFVLTQTIGKLANIASEIGELDKFGEGTLKAYTSGDRMTFNRKNKSLIEAVPTARLTLGTNNRPRFSDRSGGIWRRLILFPLTVQISESERKFGMDQATWWRATGELPAMFHWAMEGLRRLKRNNRFTIPAESAQAMDDYRSESNPAREFLIETYEENAGGNVCKHVVYEAYKKWCEKNGYRTMSERTFGREVHREFPNTQNWKCMDFTTGRRMNSYRGIELRENHSEDEWEFEQPESVLS